MMRTVPSMWRSSRLRRVVAAAALCVVASARPVCASTTADQAAAIVVFPHVVVDTAVGIDTVIQLGSANPEFPTTVRCALENHTGQCPCYQRSF